ncbi:hypothetical protein BC834DRAFT_845995 [Gloeopeniophorella convolvens]|nr:hypothetical protein BC834DRAFT_845995 [Gloeopeniophorella convolvens]
MELYKLPVYPDRRVFQPLPRQTSGSSSPASSTGASSSSSTASSSSSSTSSSETSSSSSSSSSSSFTSSNSTSPSSSPSSTPASTPPPPTSTPPTNATSAPPTAPSGFFLSTLGTSSFVTEVNGTPTTVITPIVTALRDPAPSHASARTAGIAGGAIGGLALLLLGLTALFIARRRAHRAHYSALALKPPPSRAAFLASEYDPTPSPEYLPLAPADRDPFATPPPTAARLLRARGSGSGSIFEEAVWPPPGAGSRLADPLAGPDLGRIVDDVMGPSRAASAASDTALLVDAGAGHTHEDSTHADPDADAEFGARAPGLGLTLTLTNPDPVSPRASTAWLARSPRESAPPPLHPPP